MAVATIGKNLDIAVPEPAYSAGQIIFVLSAKITERSVQLFFAWFGN
jgi:hypothetical protein